MSDERKPWLKFYPTDWRGDAGLRGCGFAARGLWMDLLTLMHEAEPYGSLLVNGRQPSVRQLAAMLGGAEKQVAALLAELEEAGVFSRKDDGTIFSRRMERDADRAERDKTNGQRGGNPSLKPERSTKVNGSGNGGVNPPHNGDDNGEDKAHSARARPSTARGQSPEAREEERSSLRSLRVSAPNDFDQFWARYPRKVGKGDARKAWTLANVKATPQAILAGLERSVFDQRERFIPHPATWLNGERWLDQPPEHPDAAILRAVGLDPDEQPMGLLQ